MQNAISSHIVANTGNMRFTHKNGLNSNQNGILQKDGVNNAQNAEKMKEEYSKIDAKELTNGYLAFYQNQSAQNSSFNFEAQFSAFSFSNLAGAFSNSSKTANEISNILSGIDLKSIGYEGKPISELSREEASDLVSEKGFFGIANTADRMSGFVINGAGDDLEKLKAGREGMARGYEAAKKAWGGELPEISQKTMQKALESVDKRIAQLGGNVLNVQA